MDDIALEQIRETLERMEKLLRAVAEKVGVAVTDEQEAVR